MSIVTSLTFNAFQENTYIIADVSKQAVIIDPGCQSQPEQQELVDHISTRGYRVTAVINTHCHVDHVFGNRFSVEHYGVPLWIHEGELSTLRSYPQVAAMYGLPGEPSPEPDHFLVDGQVFTLGETTLEVAYTPGHSPASISLICHEDKYVIAGDVLFQQSIGRTDLPGGNYDTLIQSIRTRLLILDDEYVVYPGHGPQTTIGSERSANPFLVA